MRIPFYECCALVLNELLLTHTHARVLNPKIGEAWLPKTLYENNKIYYNAVHSHATCIVLNVSSKKQSLRLALGFLGVIQ